MTPQNPKLLPLFPAQAGAILTQHTSLLTDNSQWGDWAGVCNANASGFYSNVEQSKCIHKILTSHKKKRVSGQIHTQSQTQAGIEPGAELPFEVQADVAFTQPAKALSRSQYQ